VDRFLSHRGFDIAQAIRQAMELSQGTLPIFVQCGALQPSVQGYVDTDESDSGDTMTSRIIQQISDAQQEVAEKRLRSVLTQRSTRTSFITPEIAIFLPCLPVVVPCWYACPSCLVQSSQVRASL
jgi:hypothetical protein